VLLVPRGAPARADAPAGVDLVSSWSLGLPDRGEQDPELSIIIVCPSSPPNLTPAAARALLRLLLAVAQQRDGEDGANRDQVA